MTSNSSNTRELHGRVALITGAARRIGAVIARTLHREGMHVVLHYRSSEAEARALRDELDADRPGSAALLAADFNRIDDYEVPIAEALGHWGRLDAVIHNASTFYPTPLGSITSAQWSELFDSNLRAPFFLSQAAAGPLAEQRGTIVSITDIHAERPLKGYSAYCIAKAGLAMMTRSLARELGPEVRVNAVAPGAILWPEDEPAAKTREKILARTALKRQGEPDDIARTVLFLVRDAPYITGQVIAVDGGRSLYS